MRLTGDGPMSRPVLASSRGFAGPTVLAARRGPQPPDETMTVTPPRAKSAAEDREAKDTAGAVDDLAAFRNEYKKAKRPRFTVFLNRELSDTIRGQRGPTEHRVTTEERSSRGGGSLTASGISVQDGDVAMTAVTAQASSRSKEKARTTTSTWLEEEADLSPRPLVVEEKWIWALEEGFVQALLDQHVRLVDRATILRLRAAKGKEEQALPTIEMKALEEFTDVVVELLVSEDADSPIGYSFRASAKKVANGEILVNGTLMDWSRSGYRIKKKAVVTSSGYETVPDVIPTVRQVGSDLATGLMLALEEHWSS